MPETQATSLPDLLYHYTTPAGLLGILESKSIWATNHRYLNDIREYSLALDRALAELEKLREPVVFGSAYFLDQWQQYIEGVKELDTFVTSFSKNGDLLSQWRAYSGSVPGYAIGFSSQILKEIAESQGFDLAPCRYDEEKIRKILQNLLKEAWESAIEIQKSGKTTFKGREYDSHEGIALDLGVRLSMVAPLVKHSSFIEEEEWRIFGRKYGKPIFVRISRSGLIPYRQLDLSKASMFAISEIIVGPGPDQDLAENALDFLLKSHQIPASVTLSRIPFRARR